MAPKQSIPLKMPPLASSSSGEEETGSEEEEEEEVPETNSGEEEEVPKKPGGEDEEEEEEEDFVVAQKSKKMTQKSLPSFSSKLTPAKSDKENESETESGSKIGRPKADPKNKGKAVAASPWKRKAEEDGDEKEAKRSKKKEGDTDVGEKSSNDVKKTPFQRVWSEDHEVALLEGMINYMKKNGVDTIKCTASFHEFIKKYLDIEISLSQLKDKIFRLKKMFANNRKGKMGEEKIFKKGHDQKVFDLSKRIWGSEVVVAAFGESAFKSNWKVKTKEEANADDGGSNLKVESLYFDRSSDYVMRKGLELMQGAKKDEMDEKLRQLHVEELKLFLRRNELVRECANVVLAAYDNKMAEN